MYTGLSLSTHWRNKDSSYRVFICHSLHLECSSPSYHSGSLSYFLAHCGYTVATHSITGLNYPCRHVATFFTCKNKLDSSQHRSPGAYLFLSSYLGVVLGRAASNGHSMLGIAKFARLPFTVRFLWTVPPEYKQHGSPGFRSLNFPWNMTNHPDINHAFKDTLIPEQSKLCNFAKIYYIPLYFVINSIACEKEETID